MSLTPFKRTKLIRTKSIHFCLLIVVVILPLFTSGCTGTSGFLRKNVVEIKQEQIFAEGIKRLVLNNRNGNININVWEKGEVKVEATKRLKGYKVPEALELQLQEFEIKVSRDNDVLVMDAGYAGDQKNIDGLIEVVIYVPNILKSVEAKLALGNLNIRELTGIELNAELHIGNIEMTKFEGKVNANVNTGNIRVVSGKLLDGTVLRTNIGTIDPKVELEEKGRYQFFVNMGNVELKLPSYSSAVITGKNSFFANEFSDKKTGAQVQIDVEMGRVTIRRY